MDVPFYVSRRMLYDICGIPMRELSEYERIYEKLMDWVIHYTQMYRGRLFVRLPPVRETEEDLLLDMITIFRIVLSQMDAEDDNVIQTLFIISYYLMKKYEESPKMCGNISFYFEALTYRFTGWTQLCYDVSDDVV